MDVTVIVVTHDSERDIEGFLASLLHTYQRRLSFEVIVADSGSTDRTGELVRRGWPGVRLIELGANLGYAAGINAGVAARRGAGPVLVANPDVRFNAGCVPGLLDELCDPDVGIVVPRLTDGHGALLPSLRREPTIMRRLAEAAVGGSRTGRFGEVIREPAQYRNARDVAWATGAVMLISKSCWDALGGWDESFFLYSEEVDFALRAGDHGFRVRYTPVARAVHAGGESDVRADLWSLLSRNRVELYRRRHGAVASGVFKAVTLLGEGVRAVAGRETSRAAFWTVARPAPRSSQW